ncbi:MAG: hypothetical protein AB1695_06130 [Stygiobacter sp.]
MKKLYLVLLLLSFPSFAQEKSFQIDIGVNRSWFIYDQDIFNNIETDFIINPNISFHYNFASFENFTTSIGIRYYNLGRTITLDVFGRGQMETISVNHYLLSLPLQLKYSVDIINTNVFLNAEPALILKSNSRGISPANTFITERNITSEMNRVQFLIGVGFEYCFIISEQSLGIKTFYNYSLTKIPKEGMFKDSYNQEFSYVGYQAMEVGILVTYHF